MSSKQKPVYAYHKAIGKFRIDNLPSQQNKATYKTPSEWARHCLHFTPDPAQSQILDTPLNRIIVNCTRQWGKSTTAAIRALHQALHSPASLTLILSPSLRQSGELYGKILNLLHTLNLPRKTDARNQLSLEFPNRSRIVALPGNETTIRGFSAASLVIIDEAARVPDPLFRSALPFLATTNGTLLIMSTPPWPTRLFLQRLGQPSQLAPHRRPRHRMPPHQ